MILFNKVFLFGLIFSSVCFSQAKSADVYVDVHGIMRWKVSDKEVALFGVNYTVPFAYSYRAHKKLGLDIKKAIDLDVAQMVRLELDAFRVHVWDREISDRDGNLLKNEHLDLFDYLISKLAANGIKSIITPIAWWGTGWPEQDIETPGFSQIYSKVDLVTNAKAREAQRKYLNQFINHVNPYTKTSYKNELSVIAIEIINEPKHPNNEQQVTEYVNEMYDVLRAAGVTKPIFYNISENWSELQANAVSKSKAEGVSFQWYPTGLVHGKMLEGNYLLNVNEYKIPSEGVEQLSKKAKMIYEFDAADVGSSYIYPAMARSYREAGMQFAAMFSYDPVQIAWSNTEYPTHFLNLLYTPSKAISLLIASKAFHSLELNKSYGGFPDNNDFDEYTVSASEDLSVMNNDTSFYYSNDTKSTPKNELKLTHIAGVGSSPIINYDGTGAYFLDKLENGIWRLELYPDAVWLKDPFEQTSMSRQVSKLYWIERNILVNISELGEGFRVKSISNSKWSDRESAGQQVKVEPGVYILYTNAVGKKAIEKYSAKKIKFLDGLYIPQKITLATEVVNKTNTQALTTSKLNFQFQIVSEYKIKSANLFVKRLGWRGFKKYLLENVGAFNYSADDTTGFIQDGTLQYCVSVETEKGVQSFPGEKAKSPEDWDFSHNDLWSINICKPQEPVVLLDANRDQRDLIFPQYNPSMRYSVDYSSGTTSEKNSIALKISFADKSVIPFGIQLNTAKIIQPFISAMDDYNTIVIQGKENSGGSYGINLIMNNGKQYSVKFSLAKSWQEVNIPMESFKVGSALILPNSYPQFLPKTWNGKDDEMTSRINLADLDFIQITCERPNYAAENKPTEVEFKIESVTLKRN